MDSSPSGEPYPIYRASTRIARVQVAIALVLGLSAFFTFSVLRLKYPKIYVANLNHINQNYLHSATRHNLPPLPKLLLGWIPLLYNVNEKQILEHAGLDAVVFLSFFKMCIHILTVCVVFAVTVISPIRYRFTGRVDLPDDDDMSAAKSKDHYHSFLWMYTAFTYVFTFVTAYFLVLQTVRIINMRQKYLGKQNSVTDRTIKISGIPPVLRDDDDLKRHINLLGIGEVDSVTIVKEWTSLQRLFRMRARILRQTEYYWVEYLHINGIRSKLQLLNLLLRPSVGDSISMGGLDLESIIDHIRDTLSSPASIDPVRDTLSTPASPQSASTAALPLLSDDLSRPKFKKGWLGWFGPSVDAISYYTDQLRTIDAEIRRAQRRQYPPSSTAFVTMKSVAQAQMIAQAVLDPKLGHLITQLAPAPHDIIWDNLCLTRRERNLRIFLVTMIIGLVSVLLIYPVRYLTNFLNVRTISKVWPALGDFLRLNELAKNLVTGILPPYVFTIFNVIMPHFYAWISRRQGYTSHLDEELSTVSKNFFYIFVNLFLVFTLFGTASLSDTTRIAYKLAELLKGLGLFYVDLIILQGLGMYPYKLLLLGNLVRFSFGSLFWCKTPRDYLKLYKPPDFNFGLQLPQPMLILVITITYSVMSTRILSAGLIYFIVGYFVSKYQLLYACVHPPHSTGKVWPLVFRRVILALLIFQLTMVGVLALEKAYLCALFLAPLPVLTLGLLWNYQQSYIPLLIFIALRLIEDNHMPYHDEEAFVETPQNDIPQDSRAQTLDERRELNQTYQYPHLLDKLDGPLVAIDDAEVLIIAEDGQTVRKPTQLVL